MSGAVLNSVIWIHPPIVKETNFKNAKINDKKFIKYLKENGAINVPDEPVED